MRNTVINETFENHFEPQDKSGLEILSYTKCVFKKSVQLCDFKLRICEFIDCVFEGPINIEKSIIDNIEFHNCKLALLILDEVESEYSWKFTENTIGTVRLSGNCGNLFFSGCGAENIELLELNTKETNVPSSITFENNNKINSVSIIGKDCNSSIIFSGGVYDDIKLSGEFRKNIQFNGSISSKELFIESAHLKGRIDIANVSFDRFRLSRSRFENLVLLNGYQEKVYEDVVTPIKIQFFNIISCSFESNVTIMSNLIGRFSIVHCNFNKLMTYDGLSFITNERTENPESTLQFRGINQGHIIIDNLILEECTLSDINLAQIFFRNITIHYSLVANKFHNRGDLAFINLSVGKYLVISDSNLGHFNLSNLKTSTIDEIIICNSDIKGIQFSNYPEKVRSYGFSELLDFGLIEMSQNAQNLKSVYNQLKTVAKQNGDIDIAGKFQSIEFWYLLRTKKFGFDTILLGFNGLSNKFGNSWFRGVLFTIGISFLTFIIYVKQLGVVLDQPLFQNFILYFTSFPRMGLNQYDLQNQEWNVQLVIWFARIATSYGIFQTIAAFRKYSKK